ncbi:MAG: class I SAM-dependent methyltransferase [Thermoanaerobaculia bacterium]
MLKPSEYWDREVTAPVTPPSHSWTAHPEVRHYINRNIGGENGTWPLDWFQRVYADRVFERALSIGCGTGSLERDLVRRGIAKHVDAFDASTTSIEIARAAAAAEKMSISYSVADFNSLRLPEGGYDLVCFHQSLHHVQELEHLLRQVRKALRPGGLLYLDEFIGPSRTFWNDYTIRWYRALYRLFPRNVRYFDEFAMPIQEEDPSEAIRSSEIYSRLVIGFSIEQFRGYGGNLLAMLFPDLLVDQLPGDLVRTVIAAEQSLIAAGAPHFHAVIIARPKFGFSGRLADIRYRAEDKLPHITQPFRSFIRRLRGRREDYW